MSTIETINLMRQNIDNISEYAYEQASNQSENLARQIYEISNKTISVIETAIAKVEETSNEVVQDQNFEEFLAKVEEKCNDAYSYTIKKIDELVSKENYDIKLQDTAKQIQEAFDAITSSEEVKDVMSSIKEVSYSLHQQLEEYLAKPETKVMIKHAKETTLRCAEKGYVALRKFLEEDNDQAE